MYGPFGPRDSKPLTWEDIRSASERAREQVPGPNLPIVSPQMMAAMERLLHRDTLWYVRFGRWLSFPFRAFYYRHIYWRFIHKEQDWGDYPPT